MAVVLKYNEQKVREQQAECIYAGNFLKKAADLTRGEKLTRFTDLIQLNRGVDRNVLHVFLNFYAGDIIDRDISIRISKEYMKSLGFGAQPYLVYRHHDAGHPHLHIVSTNIRPDGSRIDMRYIGKRQNHICRELTIKYKLPGPTKHKKAQYLPAKLKYGVDPSFPAIASILRYVIEQYRFRSLDELNAILQLYNVKANPGLPGSRLLSRGGLLYHMLDIEGKQRSVPVKASRFPFKPTLKNLTARFEQNKTLDPSILSHIRRVLQPLATQPVTSQPLATQPFPAQTPSNPAETLRLNRLALSEQGPEIYVVDLEGRVVVTARDLAPSITPDTLRAIKKAAHTPTLTQTETQNLKQQRHQNPSHRL